MREIKFRAWHKKEQIMFNVGGLINMDYRENHENRYATIARGGGRPKDATPQIQEIELMQYTGLKDKNGKEIYEGDILHWHNEWLDDPEIEDDGIVQVVFEMGHWLLKKVSGNDLGRWGLWKNIDDQDTEGDISFEVIGNIYENKELLDGTR